MNELERRLTDLLERDAARTPLVGIAPDGLRRRVRSRQARSGVIAGLTAAAVVAASIVGLRALAPAPITVPAIESSRPVVNRVVSIEGFTTTSPSNWFMVDYWPVVSRLQEIQETGGWRSDAPGAEWFPPHPYAGIPVFQLTNYDAGLGAPVCGVVPDPHNLVQGGNTLPLDGVGIYISLQQGAMRMDTSGWPRWPDRSTSSAEPCGAGRTAVFAVDRASFASPGGQTAVPYLAWVGHGPDAAQSDIDRATAILDSMTYADPAPDAVTDLSDLSRPSLDSPGYVIAADGDGTLEARPDVDGALAMTTLAIDPDGTYTEGGGKVALGADPFSGIANFGLVTQDADRVEYRFDDGSQALVAALYDLPPSLGVNADAYVFGDRFPTQDDPRPGTIAVVDPNGSVMND